MTSILNWIAVLLLLVAGAGLLLGRNWRWTLGFLAVQYLAAFWLTSAHWPVAMAAVKLITGWVACAALGMTQTALAEHAEEITWPQSGLFRAAAAGLVWTVSLALAVQAAAWLGMALPVAWGSLLLMGMGLLILGLTAQPLRLVIGLLSLLAGFEILYATVETSALVAALLAAVTLGLALAGAYLLQAGAPEEETR